MSSLVKSSVLANILISARGSRGVRWRLTITNFCRRLPTFSGMSAAGVTVRLEPMARHRSAFLAWSKLVSRTSGGRKKAPIETQKLHHPQCFDRTQAPVLLHGTRFPVNTVKHTFTIHHYWPRVKTRDSRICGTITQTLKVNLFLSPPSLLSTCWQVLPKVDD